MNRLGVFEFGSRWLKVDFHLHTRADKEFKYFGEDNDYLKKYIDSLHQADIGLGVISNHNKFNLDEFKKLRKKAKQREIGLLAGIELSIKDGLSGVHTLVVFSDEWFTNKENKNYIQDFMNVTFSGVPNFENENARSNQDIIETVRELDRFNKDYFLIFAHVEASNGLWGGLAPGRIKELFENMPLRRRALGFQKVRTHDSRVIIQQSLGEAYPAEVEGSDPKKLEDISLQKNATFLKLGALSFNAVKFALCESGSRVKSKPPQLKHSYIRKIHFEGVGSLGGREICFSPELNALIGIRGSGKSSVLEGIRYALNISFGETSSDLQYKEGLLQHLLQSGGKITIDAMDRHGLPYQIIRILGERPDVYFDGKIQPGVSIQETVLHFPLYFGQKDLSNSGAGFEKDLIEKLLGERLHPVRQKRENAVSCVQSGVDQIKRLNKTVESKEEWLQKKQDLEFKLNVYQEHGVEDKLQKQMDFERDERKAQKVIKETQHYLTELNNVIESVEDDLRNQIIYTSSQNLSFFNDFFSTFKTVLESLDSIKLLSDKNLRVIEQLNQKLTFFQEKKQALKDEFSQIERHLAGELKEAGAQAISPEEFKKIKSLLENVEQMLLFITKSEDQYTQLHHNLSRYLNELNALSLEEFQEIEEALNKINRLGSPLKILPQFKADKPAMLKYIQDLYRGSRIREATLKSVVDEFRDFSEVFQNKNKLQSMLGNTFDIFWSYFEEHLGALLAWQVPHVFTIEYHGKPLAHHSLGQRASALILFILSQRKNDVVIIDQPEDDLDNQTIYNDVIKLVLELKPNTQFIFATHNANIPVLGDAEQIMACECKDDHIDIFSGSIDCVNVQKKIVRIMEGGTEAFEKRKQVYEAWKSKNF